MNLDECINFLLTNAQHKVFMKMKNDLANYDVTPIQYGVIYCINQLDSNNPKDIANYLCIENSTLSGILDRMEKKDLISREIDEYDRRYIKVYLTEKAKTIIPGIYQTAEDVNEEVLSIFSNDEKDDLKRYLKRLSTL